MGTVGVGDKSCSHAALYKEVAMKLSTPEKKRLTQITSDYRLFLFYPVLLRKCILTDYSSTLLVFSTTAFRLSDASVMIGLLT